MAVFNTHNAGFNRSLCSIISKNMGCDVGIPIGRCSNCSLGLCNCILRNI